jgi:hypothetical protein
MNIIDIIAIIPYFITLATVVAEEEDTLNLPKAPVSPQVARKPDSRKTFQFSNASFLPFFLILHATLSSAGQVNESGYVLSNTAGDTFSSSVSNLQTISTFEGLTNFRTNTKSIDARTRLTHIFPLHW